ncbi:MAG: response regulator transcription factor [Bacteroidetes bacterium]|nr:response regulator transcription factor [Bacteroidota bacterium]
MRAATHILLVEDEPDAGQLLRDYLEMQGYLVTWETSGAAALLRIQQEGHSLSLAVLDVMLPEVDGLRILAALRAQRETLHLPVLLLTALDREADVVRGLAMGADAYVRKPAGLAEIHAHVLALLRRHRTESDHIALGALLLEPSQLRASYAGRELGLTPTEYYLLHLLAGQPRRIFSREELADALGAREDKVMGIRTVDAHIKNLRHKLGAEAAMIATQRGLGYGINPESI